LNRWFPSPIPSTTKKYFPHPSRNPFTRLYAWGVIFWRRGAPRSMRGVMRQSLYSPSETSPPPLIVSSPLAPPDQLSQGPPPHHQQWFCVCAVKCQNGHSKSAFHRLSPAWVPFRCTVHDSTCAQDCDGSPSKYHNGALYMTHPAHSALPPRPHTLFLLMTGRCYFPFGSERILGC
jgi:hypothetical protein